MEKGKWEKGNWDMYQTNTNKGNKSFPLFFPFMKPTMHENESIFKFLISWLRPYVVNPYITTIYVHGYFKLHFIS